MKKIPSPLPASAMSTPLTRAFQSHAVKCEVGDSKTQLPDMHLSIDRDTILFLHAYGPFHGMCALVCKCVRVCVRRSVCAGMCVYVFVCVYVRVMCECVHACMCVFACASG